MENDNDLIQLVEQAASCVTVLNPTDLSDVQALQEVLHQIGAAAGDLNQAPLDLRQQLETTTAQSVEVLESILQQDVEDTAKALETVSQAVCLLQGLIGRLANPAPGPVPAPSEPPAVPPAQPSASTDSGAMTISAEDAPLVQDFITESTEHLEGAESALLELENHPADSELINKIFRGFHTIKGMAGFLNLTEVQSLAHSSESLLDLARKNQLVLVGDISDVVFEAIDSLKKMLASLKTSVETGQPVAAHEPLARLLDKLKAAAEGRLSVSPPVVAQAQETDKKLDAILEDPAGAPKQTAGPATAHAADDKIKVSTTRLDNLVNLAGELVIAQLMVAEEVNGGQAQAHGLLARVAHQGKIVRELQELSMSMRMVPIQGVFQKMSRLARDLSRKASKQVDFITTVEETELDRTVVDKIADPLVHMVRNAIDHGIEPTEVRTKAGKNPGGRVELRAFHQAGNIVIEMEDDGKGLDKDRIVKKAVEQGLVEPGQELSEDDAFRLIFHPGLSTAEKVTSISGRGVGMDVVKKNIEALRGRIEIRSTQGKGTTFTIRLPLTLAVIDGQVVRIGSDRYIMPINSIVRSLRPTRDQLSTVQGRGELILERGAMIPMVRLYKLFGVVPSTEDPMQALVVVVEADGRKCCLLVDDLLGQQQVVIKNLGEALGQVRGVSGGAIMGDGRVTLILDVPGLVTLAQEQ
jgi:two-component system chemotaxis sensor kinase CheA